MSSCDWLLNWCHLLVYIIVLYVWRQVTWSQLALVRCIMSMWHCLLHNTIYCFSITAVLSQCENISKLQWNCSLCSISNGKLPTSIKASVCRFQTNIRTEVKKWSFKEYISFETFASHTEVGKCAISEYILRPVHRACQFSRVINRAKR